MKDIEQRKAAKEFAERWKDKGYEKGESQKYWIDLLENVLGISNAVDFIHFEDTVHIDKATGFIDGFIINNSCFILFNFFMLYLQTSIKSITKIMYKIVHFYITFFVHYYNTINNIYYILNSNEDW